jgi:Xaa-Pro aminopeptidase
MTTSNTSAAAGSSAIPAIPTDLPFSVVEYRERRERVRAAMESRGIDILYVTSPANLYYLTGYEAIWYPNRLPLGAAVDRDRAEVVFFDWTRHDAYVRTRVLCDEVVLVDYGTAPEAVARAFVQRAWTQRIVGIEWSSSNPTAPVMSALADLLRNAGTTLITGDWLVDQVRLYKSPAEVARIRQAAAIADSAMLQLQRDLRPGMSGLEVSAHLSLLLARRGSEVAAMAPLVNSGPTAWTDTHSFPSKRRLESGDVVCVDCCAVIDRYHVNLGRTFALGTPNERAARILTLAAGSVLELQRAARRGEGPEAAAAAANRFVRERIAAEQVWWVGGYALGIAFAPSWVGHTYLANDGMDKCRLDTGYVSNYENVFIDREAGFEAAYIDTILMTDAGLEVLSSMPRTLLPSGA